MKVIDKNERILMTVALKMEKGYDYEVFLCSVVMMKSQGMIMREHTRMTCRQDSL